MTTQTLPYMHAKNREYFHSSIRLGWRRYPKRPTPFYPESSAMRAIENRFYLPYLPWIRQKTFEEVLERIIFQSIMLRGNPADSYSPAVGWFQVTEKVSKRPPIDVSYNNKDSVYTLLGIKGAPILDKITNLIQKEAAEKSWPLTEIEVSYRKDPEVEDWEYLLILLHFDSSFNKADNYLNLFYARLDKLIERLNTDEKDILTRLIYIDIKTNDFPNG
jgi:hypothetical protein